MNTVEEQKRKYLTIRDEDIQNMTTYSVYILIDPRDERIWYVGVTTRLHERLYAHISDLKDNAHNPDKEAWITSLREAETKPIMQVIETYRDKKRAYSAEGYWIRKYYQEGEPIVNYKGLAPILPPLEPEPPPVVEKKPEPIQKKRPYRVKNPIPVDQRVFKFTEEEIPLFVEKFKRHKSIQYALAAVHKGGRYYADAKRILIKMGLYTEDGPIPIEREPLFRMSQ